MAACMVATGEGEKEMSMENEGREGNLTVKCGAEMEEMEMRRRKKI